MLVLFGVAYFLSLFFRTVNAILSERLEADLGLDTASLGLLTAAYFFGVGLAQIPIGICLDAYGPRRVQGVTLCIAAVGIAIFGLTDSVPLLVLARTLIGIGLAGCLMSAFQVSMLWLSADKVPMANGLYLAAGGLGALAATAPVNFALEFLTWQQMFLLIAVVTLALAGGIAAVTPDPASTSKLSWRTRLRTLSMVARNRRLWRYLPLTALCFGTGSAMQGLWAADWMRAVAGHDANAIGWTLAMMALSLTVGSAVGGVLSLVLERRGFKLEHVILGSACLFILAEIGLAILPPDRSFLPWLLFALTYNVVTLSYAHVARAQPTEGVGSSNALMNSMVILVTFTIQFGLGVFLAWAGEADPAASYLLAFGGLIGLQAIALVWCCYPTARQS
ncbi:MFS transporter [Roseovarius spongiae]|uniref:MFS transporter n=1 Tax=Roseovarius spongiae TaxID=2320272 RepID=UPI001407B065|nr:MFS transporter [Roseovarius spongiae]